MVDVGGWKRVPLDAQIVERQCLGGFQHEAVQSRAQLEPLTKGPEGRVATAAVFTSDDELDDTLTGAAFAEREMSFLTPPSGKPVEDSTRARPRSYLVTEYSQADGAQPAPPGVTGWRSRVIREKSIIILSPS